MVFWPTRVIVQLEAGDETTAVVYVPTETLDTQVFVLVAGGLLDALDTAETHLGRNTLDKL